MGNIVLRYGHSGTCFNCYIVHNPMNNLGVDSLSVNTNSDYLIVVFKEKTFESGVIVGNRFYDIVVNPINANTNNNEFSYFIIVNDEFFYLQNGVLEIEGNKTKEVLSSPDATSGSVDSHGFNCVNLASRSAYYYKDNLYSDFSFLSDYGLNVCFRKKEEHVLDYNCTQCVMFDFLENKFYSNGHLSYNRYPIRGSFISSLAVINLFNGYFPSSLNVTLDSKLFRIENSL